MYSAIPLSALVLQKIVGHNTLFSYITLTLLDIEKLENESYLVDPYNGDLQNLGRITLFSGAKSILREDSRNLHAKLEKLGIDSDYYEY